MRRWEGGEGQDVWYGVLRHVGTMSGVLSELSYHPLRRRRTHHEVPLVSVYLFANVVTDRLLFVVLRPLAVDEGRAECNFPSRDFPD